MRHREITTITHRHVVQALADDKEVFADLDSRVVNRSFPVPGQHLTPGAARILKRALSDGSVPFNESDEGINICYYMGWIHRTLSFDGTEDVAVLPSRLHEKYFRPNSFWFILADNCLGTSNTSSAR